MSEAKAIRMTKRPVTRASLARDLKKIGVARGDVLLVHTAFRKIGWVNGGPQALIEALVDAVGEAGTIVMTAQTNLSDPAEWGCPPVPKDWVATIRRTMPAYDPNATPTRGQGAVPEYFRSYPSAVRSGHPTIAFSALGKRARSFMAKHTLEADFSDASPLGKMVRAEAKVLMIGTDYTSCTALHLAEHRSASAPHSRHGAPMMVDGKRKWIWYNAMDHNSDDFDAIGRAFERKYTDHVTKDKLGLAPSRLVDMATLVEFGAEWMGKNRGCSSN